MSLDSESGGAKGRYPRCRTAREEKGSADPEENRQIRKKPENPGKSPKKPAAFEQSAAPPVDADHPPAEPRSCPMNLIPIRADASAARHIRFA